jgi:DNA-binding beta-propeller fold protein YncE
MKSVSIPIAIGSALLACIAVAQSPATGPYKIVKTAKTGGDGGFDYIYADSDGRRLYIPRSGQQNARIDVFDLDTLAPAGSVPNANARGAATDTKSGHGFVSSSPVVMFDTKTLAVIKTIAVEGGPDGILADPFNQRVYIFSHRAPNATVINEVDGTLVGTIDLGGAPEQAVTDGKGHIYVDLEDKDNIAVVDAKTMTVTAHYDVKEKAGGPGGLALDAKNHILFAACHDPAMMVILNADSGKILAALPLDGQSDGAGFNPNTMEAFSSHGNGTLTVIKENSPTSFAVEQTVQTMAGAKTMTIDTKTNRVLTMAAQYGPPPAPAAAPPTPPAGVPGASGAGRGRGRGPGRGPMLPDSFTILAIGTN